MDAVQYHSDGNSLIPRGFCGRKRGFLVCLRLLLPSIDLISNPNPAW
jgi:hypothetical protein